MTIDRFGRHLSGNENRKIWHRHHAPHELEGASTSSINLENRKIINLHDPEEPQDACNKKYVDFRSQIVNHQGLAVNFGGKRIRRVGDPVDDGDAINKLYLQTHSPTLSQPSDKGFDCRMRTLSNVGTPTHPQDAVTLQYMIDYIHNWSRGSSTTRKTSSRDNTIHKPKKI